MTRFRLKVIIPVLAILSFVVGVLVVSRAQQPVPGATPVQPAQPFYNCNQQATATSAGNGAAAVTLTPPAGQYVYVCGVHIVEVANAAVTGAAGPAPIFTTGGLQNNLVWWGDNSSLTIGQQKIVVSEVYPLLIKTATPGTAFTITNSTGQSTQNVRINVTAFFAP